MCQYSNYSGGSWPPEGLISARGDCECSRGYGCKCILEMCPNWEVFNDWYKASLALNITVIFICFLRGIFLILPGMEDSNKRQEVVPLA